MISLNFHSSVYLPLYVLSSLNHSALQSRSRSKNKMKQIKEKCITEINCLNFRDSRAHFKLSKLNLINFEYFIVYTFLWTIIHQKLILISNKFPWRISFKRDRSPSATEAGRKVGANVFFGLGTKFIVCSLFAHKCYNLWQNIIFRLSLRFVWTNNNFSHLNFWWSFVLCALRHCVRVSLSFLDWHTFCNAKEKIFLR